MRCSEPSEVELTPWYNEAADESLLNTSGELEPVTEIRLVLPPGDPSG